MMALQRRIADRDALNRVREQQKVGHSPTGKSKSDDELLAEALREFEEKLASLPKIETQKRTAA